MRIAADSVVSGARAGSEELAVGSVKALGFLDGIFHVECKYTSMGPQLIEARYRAPRLGAFWVDCLGEKLLGGDLNRPQRPLLGRARMGETRALARPRRARTRARPQAYGWAARAQAGGGCLLHLWVLCRTVHGGELSADDPSTFRAPTSARDGSGKTSRA